MNESQLHSVHLEGLPRREEFRRARARLRGACGEHTLAGALLDIDLDAPPADSPTCLHLQGGPKSPSQVHCFLEDGTAKHELHVGMNSVGRLGDNDVVIADASISRRHCAIVIHSDMSVELHDTASKNGTMLNGRKLLTPTRLNHNDTITICDRTLRFRMTGAESSASGPNSSPADDVGPGEKTQIEHN